jgi:cob(I)alamin adenosyltransferase
VKAKIYTKTGDRGQTSLLGGARVAKTDARLEAYGTLDELNSILGLVRTQAPQFEAQLQRVQNTLFNIGSQLACEVPELHKQLPDLRAQDVESLEQEMDQWEAELPPLKNFILPGGFAGSGFAHLARTVCRRAERLCVALMQQHPVDEKYAVYLNRLSDWLFVLARKLNSDAGQADILWTKD